MAEFIAWQWDSFTVGDEFVHGLGAFLTSPGLAGLVAGIAAWQVWRNRRDERARYKEEQAALQRGYRDERNRYQAEQKALLAKSLVEMRRYQAEQKVLAEKASDDRERYEKAFEAEQRKQERAQLWERFQWLDQRSDRLGFTAAAQALAGLQEAAQAADDAHLAELSRMLRAQVLKQVLRQFPEGVSGDSQ